MHAIKTYATPAGNLVWVPTREEIENLKVGDRVLDVWGRFAPITSITYTGTNINGQVYIGYYTAFGDNGTISHSIVEGEVCATMPIISEFLRIDNINVAKLIPNGPVCLRAFLGEEAYASYRAGDYLPTLRIDAKGLRAAGVTLDQMLGMRAEYKRDLGVEASQ